MQYMLLSCFDESSWETLSDERKQAITREYGAVIQQLLHSGHFRGGGRLHPTSAATTVRMQHGKIVISDGPFAETKEQFGGYHLIECKDLDEAIGIAGRFPTLPAGGAIEIRPLVLSEHDDAVCG